MQQTTPYIVQGLARSHCAKKSCIVLSSSLHKAEFLFVSSTTGSMIGADRHPGDRKTEEPQMTIRLKYEELELAWRLTPDYVDKRALTVRHRWQVFAPIKLGTWHRRLARMEIAEIKQGKYGTVLLRRGRRWEDVMYRWGRAERDKGVILRLESQILVQDLRSILAAPVDQAQRQQKIVIRRRADTSTSKGATIIQFRSQAGSESRT